MFRTHRFYHHADLRRNGRPRRCMSLSNSGSAATDFYFTCFHLVFGLVHDKLPRPSPLHDLVLEIHHHIDQSFLLRGKTRSSLELTLHVVNCCQAQPGAHVTMRPVRCRQTLHTRSWKRERRTRDESRAPLTGRTSVPVTLWYDVSSAARPSSTIFHHAITQYRYRS